MEKKEGFVLEGLHPDVHEKLQ